MINTLDTLILQLKDEQLEEVVKEYNIMMQSMEIFKHDEPYDYQTLYYKTLQDNIKYYNTNFKPYDTLIISLSKAEDAVYKKYDELLIQNYRRNRYEKWVN